jgi:CheY-like chemotaxis protein/AraC-like DNA-binding protein
MKWENTQTPRILVVDDNSRIHADFDLVFSRRQRNPELEADQNEIYGQSEPPAISKPTYELDHAFSGREGIEKTQSSIADGRPYQVAFVDIRMPGLDGVETIERIWAIDPRIQVVICTAFADYRWEDLADRLGQSDKLLVLKKPFDHIEAFQLACTLSEKWFLTRHAALKFEQMELLVAQRTQRILDLQRRGAERTHELEQIKLRLLTSLSEEFRGALTQVVNGLERRGGREPAEQEEALAGHDAKRLAYLVDECLSVSNLNEEDLRLRIAEADLAPFLQGVVAGLKPVANLKKAHLEFQSNVTSWPARFDAGKLEKVLVNLLTHSLETMPQNGWITVQVQLNSESMQLVMQANGVGMPKKEQPLVAGGVVLANPETSKRLPGLRLALAQELMGLQGGTLTWESPEPDANSDTSNPGTRCTLHLPLPEVSPPVQPPVEFVPPIAPVGSVPVSTIEEETSMKELPLILLVLDDADLAVSIQQGCGQDYRTILVKDGTQGLIQAREMLPDVIIAEVRLQILDGIELCRRLKSDELTGHIPIILMTDRDWESGQLQALEAGADDYLLKPFKLSLLKARVDNLRGSRHKLLELFKQVKQLYPRDIATNQSDANFIRRVIHLVEENMSDCDFDLEIMARKLAVSRRQLFRKLRAAAGCSPNIFIRTLRLKRAAQLLTESQMTVTEITYAVGFSDLKYFRNIFREYFGVAPGEFLKRSKTQ